MEDVLNTSSWQQPNTFMDIISPRAKNPAPRNIPEKSNTLMRNAVKRPEVAPVQVEVQADTQQEQPVYATSRPDLSEAAALTDKSPLISRFSPNSDYQYQTEPVFESMDPPSTVANDAYTYPVEEDQTVAAPAMELAAEQPSFNIFKNSLPAFEYNRPQVKSGSKWNIAKRLSGWTVLGVVVVGVAGGALFINRNFSKLELYAASSKAGFSATLPSVKPSGFALSGISTASGEIEASFKSNTDNRTYTISEKKSSESNNALLDGYVQNRAGMNFQTINTNANTIYVYSGHDATWVSNNIWYVVQDNNSLSNHQIIDIADSM